MCILVIVAPPIVMGAWSMAFLLGRHVKYYYCQRGRERGRLLWLLTDAEGTHVTVDVGDCVNVCNRWVSGFAGMQGITYTLY